MATDIVAIIGDYLDLKPAGGSRFKALCPFHSEKTPSFHVSRDRQTFHCFGCDKGGDVLTFIQDIDGLTFPEALQGLADRAGIRMERYRGRSDSDVDDRVELFRLNDFASRFFQSKLKDADAGRLGREYLEGRGLSEQIIADFGLGIVPEGWNHLTDAARGKGVREKLMELSGLAKQGDRGLYDRFRNRLMFPIRDVSGKVVAFGGRAMGDDDAKYINSPESPVYRKGRVLYGLYEGRDALRAAKEAILVEGYFDVLRCVDHGIKNAVATCGTALTLEQATLLRRSVDSVLVVFDGDEAGIRAALRSVGVLAEAGLSVRAMTLPDGLDPDDYLGTHGPEAFRELAVEALDFVRFYVHTSGERTGTIEGRTAVATELFAVIGNIKEAMRQEEYVKVLARELGLDPYRCQAEFTQHLQGRTQRAGIAAETSNPPQVSVNDHDRDFVSILLGNPAFVEEAWAEVGKLKLPQSVVLEVLQVLTMHDGGDPLSNLASEPAKRLFSAAASSETEWGERGGELFRERLRRFKKDALLFERERLLEEIYRAQRLNNDERLLELTVSKIDVDRQIEELGRSNQNEIPNGV